MKRMVILLVIVLLSMWIYPAISESLESMTDDELLSMYQEIQAILLSRNGLVELNLPAGRYLVGDDFPAGIYRMECKGIYSTATVKLYASAESKSRSSSYLMGELYNSSVVGKIELVAGNILDIDGSVVTFTSYNAAQITISVNEKSNGNTADKEADPIGKEGLNISPGKYQVGPEIPPGVYRVVCENPFAVAQFSVYDSENAIFPLSSTILSSLIGAKEIGKIELKRGNYVVVAEGSVKIFEYKGIGN